MSSLCSLLCSWCPCYNKNGLEPQAPESLDLIPLSLGTDSPAQEPLASPSPTHETTACVVDQVAREAIPSKESTAHTQSEKAASPSTKRSHTCPKVIQWISQSVHDSFTQNEIEAFDAFPDNKKLVIGLSLLVLSQTSPKSIKDEFIELILNSLKYNMTITTSCQEMIDLFNAFGIVQLRKPASDTLLLGCGNSGRCRYDHTNYDTLTLDAWRDPTIVADWDNTETARYFESIRKQYLRILDEGPLDTCCVDYFPTLHRVLKIDGIITIIKHDDHIFFANLKRYRQQSKFFLKPLNDDFPPPLGTYSFFEANSFQYVQKQCELKFSTKELPSYKKEIHSISQKVIDLFFRSFRSKFDALPESTKLAIGLTYKILEKRHREELKYGVGCPPGDCDHELILLIEELQNHPIDITTPCQEMLDLFNEFGVVQLRKPAYDTLVLGGGNGGRCEYDHKNCDTLTLDLWMNPTIVANWYDPKTAQYFLSIRKEYLRILDEGPLNTREKALLTPEKRISFIH